MTLHIKNLTLDVADIEQKEDWEKAVSRAFESVPYEAGFVNLVKVKLPDLPMDKVQFILRHIKEDLAEQGLTNCVFVPIHPQGIRDISIERIELDNKEECKVITQDIFTDTPAMTKTTVSGGW
jgi:hypothetical protein